MKVQQSGLPLNAEYGPSNAVFRPTKGEPHPVIVRRICDKGGVTPSSARTIAILAGLGVRA